MKHLFITTAFMMTTVYLTSCSQHVDADVNGLIPAPTKQEITMGESFALSANTVIAYTDASLQRTAELLSDNIRKQTGLSLSVEKSDRARNSILLEIDSNDDALHALPPIYGLSAKGADPADERYILAITSKGILVKGASAEGVFRGTTTLRQLTGTHTGETKVYLPATLITDSPRFAWRGLSFDVSRTFFEADEVKQVIDMLALYKINVLHFHLTDNQGWRLEIKKYPKLTEIGSDIPNQGRKGGFYTQEQYKELVAYAADRYITVVPEIDLPGHTAAVFASYPELKNAAKLSVDINIPGQALAALDPDDAPTMQFVEDVLAEVAALTPGSYLHIGGDETFGMPEDKFIRFINLAKPMVSKLGKKMVGWQEASRAGTGEGDILQNWIYFNMDKMQEESSNLTSMLPKEVADMLMATFVEAPNDIPRAIAKKAKLILSPSGFVYLDHRYAEPSATDSQEEERERLGMTAYPKQTIEEMYSWDPATYNTEHINWQNDIAGIEGAIWCETIESFADLQFLLQPRLSGVAEKGWASHGNVDWEEYKIRLQDQSPLWKNAGWNFFHSSLVDWK